MIDSNKLEPFDFYMNYVEVLCLAIQLLGNLCMLCKAMTLKINKNIPFMSEKAKLYSL